jgi:hypothetical protein
MRDSPARRLTKDIWECVVDLHCWAEAVDKSPIATSIDGGGNRGLIENLLPSLD